jgi:uncharacterized membrane protein YbhN (UPF0104 family)
VQPDTAPGSPRIRWIAAGLSAATVAALIYFVDWRVVGKSLHDLDWRWALVGLLATAMTLWCRSRRFMLILSDGRPNESASNAYLSLAAAHQAIFALLPSGTGDVVFPFLARAFVGQTVSAATVGLAVVRFQDLVTLVGIGSTAALWIWVGGATGGAITLVIGCIVLLTLFRTGAVVAFAARAACRAIDLTPLAGLLNFINRRTGDVAAWFQAHHERWNRLSTAGFGIASWISATIAVGSAMAAAGLHATPEKAAFVLFVLNVAGAMSVLTFAGLGFVEVGLAGALMLFGMDGRQAMAAAVVVRLLLLSFNLLVPAVLMALAVPGWLASVLTRPKF